MSSNAIELTSFSEFIEVNASEGKKFLVMAHLKAPQVLPSTGMDRAPVSVSAVIDRSGSMQGAKMKLTKSTLQFVINNLSEKDEFGIITYATNVSEALPLTKMDAAGHKRAAKVVSAIMANGGTNLSGGLFAGIEQLRKAASPSSDQPQSESPDTAPRHAYKPPLSSVLGLLVGNESKSLASSSTQPQGTHQWTIFTRLADGTTGSIADYVERVEYTVPSTNGSQCLTIAQEPFALSRTGCDILDIEVKVHLLPQLGGGTHCFQHTLNLASPLTYSTFKIPLSVESLPPPDIVVEMPSVVASPDNTMSCSSPKKEKRLNDVASIWLFTDGLANVGIQTRPALVEETEKLLTGLPATCSIFSFGFGRDHDAQLLKEVADTGKGMYYFMENEASISAAFADCLGGLLSVVAQKIRLTVRPMPGCTILRTFTQYVNDVKPTAAWVEIPDLYSEEERDIMFEIEVPALESPLFERVPILEWEVSYLNLANNQSECISVDTKLGRPEVAEPHQPCIEIDKQRNRLACTEAIHRSKELADMGRLDLARLRLGDALENIEQSESRHDTYCATLTEDLNDCIGQLRDATSYQARGGSLMMQMASCHTFQRSSGMKERYTTSAKIAMVDRSKNSR